MILFDPEPINFTLIFGVFCAFSFVLMLKDTVVKIMTFVKGLSLD